MCLVAQLCLTLQPHGLRRLPGFSIHGDSPGKNVGVGCHALLQGIFPTQGSNPGLPHCRQNLYCLSNQGSPFYSIICTQNIQKTVSECEYSQAVQVVGCNLMFKSEVVRRMLLFCFSSVANSCPTL